MHFSLKQLHKVCTYISCFTFISFPSKQKKMKENFFVSFFDSFRPHCIITSRFSLLLILCCLALLLWIIKTFSFLLWSCSFRLWAKLNITPSVVFVPVLRLRYFVDIEIWNITWIVYYKFERTENLSCEQLHLHEQKDLDITQFLLPTFTFTSSNRFTFLCLIPLPLLFPFLDISCEQSPCEKVRFIAFYTHHNYYCCHDYYHD